MIPQFFIQYAAGCFLAFAASASPTAGWRYYRLMASVSFGLALCGGVFLARDQFGELTGVAVPLMGVGLGLIFGCFWLVVNAVQGERIAASQRIVAAGAGCAALSAAIWLATEPTANSNVALQSGIAPTALASLSASILLGALLLGSTTTSMLLGHRYLTDTDMPIQPLRRMTVFYIVVLGLRLLWAGFATIPLWSDYRPAGSELYFWLALSVRVGVGLVVTSIFAWMAWDCVKRRSTQSATAMFYLSMFLVLVGELSAQYLRRTEGLPL